MKNEADYSLYECPYSHLKKDCGHDLHGPEGYENVYGVWCSCGFRGPVFYLSPEELKLKKKCDDENLSIEGLINKESVLNYKLSELRRQIKLEKQKNCKHFYSIYFGSHDSYEVCIYCDHIKEI